MSMPEKPQLSIYQIWNMSFGFLGIQFGWGLQMANMSPIYTYLGAKENELPYLWLAGPITGLLVQPIIGAMSDRTWTRLGRRRPYFLVGAILSSICLIMMPHCSAVWMAAGLLWILDASINTTMEPFRAFVGDLLPEKQRTTGFVTQSFFIGIGQTLANTLPFILTWAGITGVLQSGIPYSTVIAFTIGAAAFLLAVLWTVVSTKEYPPQETQGSHRDSQDHPSLIVELTQAMRQMPTTMKQLAIVQFFTWFALPCMWQYYGLAVAKHVFHAEKGTPEFQAGTEWAGLCFAVYNVACFAFAFVLPWLAQSISRKAVHSICLTLGGIGLLSLIVAPNPTSLFAGMIGVGIAWASILSMPYVILAGSIKPERMGVYMGIFNLFIVLPQIIMSIAIPYLYSYVLNEDPRNVVLFGGAMMLLAAMATWIVRDEANASISAVQSGAGH